MRIAVIDLGTNTFNLLIAETLRYGGFRTLYNEKLPVKLGEGGINKGVIAEAAFQRGLDAMAYYKELIEKYKGERILAFATSAVRNASNGNEFTDRVQETTGITVHVINGDMEADLIAIGVRQAVNLSKERSLVIDIGGGSTEFIILDDKEVFWKQSFEIGASRLLQRFTPSDPILPEEVRTIAAYLAETLESLWEAAKQYHVRELIGASGSFESLAEMVHAQFGSLPGLGDKTECEFIMQQCAFIHADILSSTREQRLRMKGLLPMRVDMIVVSAILVETVISQTNISRMRYSAYALKEGVLREFLDGVIE
jgi:exopolyphosphatase / guanosine-5'-triphosphate,3'-diphosphate pyrophosphatase